MNGANNLKILGVTSLLITICFFSFPIYAQYGGGTGEPNYPYQIAAADDLILLGETPEDYDKHFILTADIDLDPNLPGCTVFDKAVIAPDTDMETGEYVGIPFTGVFDGNDHTISHLTIVGDRYLGLFGKLDSGAIISNLGLETVDVKGIDSGVGNVIIGATSFGTGSGGAVGGLVGFNNGTIITSYSTGTVSGSGVVGGLVGFNDGIIITSYSAATVSGDGSVGGLVAWNHGTIITSYSTGTVTGLSWVGGLVGQNRDNIANCYSTGTVTGRRYVGGLVGESDTQHFDVSHVAFHGNITSSFWDLETSGHTTSAGGTGLTTDAMKDINTFLDAGWDFVDETSNGTCDYWQISPGDYPRLCCQDGNSPVMHEGLGTAEQPYLIRNAHDLGTVWFKPSAHFRLEAPVDLSGITWFIAVVPWFDGILDGNGYVISNLNIQGDRYVGLFGQSGTGAEISNLGLEAVEVFGKDYYVGSIVGYNGGLITTSYSTGSVSGDQSSIGGLVGLNVSIIGNSYSTALVSGYSFVGGLLGYQSGHITNCYSIGSVSGYRWVGGLMGGGAADNVIASFWDTKACNMMYETGGIGKTTSQMQTASTFINAGWDFVDETENGTEDNWWILEGQDYPRLWWEAFDL